MLDTADEQVIYKYSTVKGQFLITSHAFNSHLPDEINEALVQLGNILHVLMALGQLYSHTPGGCCLLAPLVGVYKQDRRDHSPGDQFKQQMVSDSC